MPEPTAARAASASSRRLRAGEVVLDPAAHLVTVRGRAVTLALQEFKLLELLMVNADRVLTNEAILEMLWGHEFEGDPGTVAVHVLRLRRKLDRSPGASRHLRTVRGLGYVFDTVPVDEA